MSGARPLTTSFTRLSSCCRFLNLCSHDNSPAPGCSSSFQTRHLIIASLPSSLGASCGPCPLARLDSASVSVPRGMSRLCCPSREGMLRPSYVCRASRGCCICLVSCSNSSIRRWLVRRSASTSFVLACIASNVPGGRLSALPGWSCILGGLALLLLVFLVDTISN